MAYIGKEPTTGNFVYADDITTSATNTYNILVGGVAFSPESANHLIVSLNGVIQKANTSFSVSGSQITFLPSSGTLSSSDSIDFILILGSVNDVGVATTVSDSAITKSKLNLISDSSSAGLTVKGDGSSENGTIQLNCSQNSHGVKISSPAHSSGQSYEMVLPTTNITAGKFLKVDSVSGSGATGVGQLSFADAGGITMVDNWRLNSSFTGDTVPIVNWERNDSAAPNFGYYGEQMSESSGIFSFPSTGFYWIILNLQFYLNGDSQYAGSEIQVTADNASYGNRCAQYNFIKNVANPTYSFVSSNITLDITDTSNQKVRFRSVTANSAQTTVADSNYDHSYVRFIKLGET